MINEINHREAREKDPEGKLQPIAVCGSRVGRHSNKRSVRAGSLEQLGPGVNLYLKMLKYFAKCFFLFFLISFPTHLIFKSGFAFSQENGIDKLLGEYSLGNLNDVITSECYSADIGL